MPVVEEICTVTARGQTTVPKSIRQALGVGYGGRIAFRADGDTVTVSASTDADMEDPALAPFLALLAADMAARPHSLRKITPAMVRGLDIVLAATGPVDPEAPIEGDVSL